MPDLLIQATLTGTSGFAEDNVVNTFAVSAPSGFSASTHGPAFADAVEAVYNNIPTGRSADIASKIGASLSRASNANQVDIYNITGHLDGSPHGSPIYSETWTLDTESGSQYLPREVALAVTLRGTGWESAAVETPDGSDPGTERDRPRQRKTGKVYFGPFNTSILDTPTTPFDARPTSAFRTDLAQAMVDLAQALDTALAGSRLCVWSRADTFLYTVTHVQVDNAFDTQRRRGIAPTARLQLATGF